MIELTQSGFNALIESGDDLILYVHSPNHAPSIVGMSAIQEVDGMYGKSFEIYCVDATQEPEICNALSVDELPCAIGIKNKKVYKRITGVVYSNQILDLLK